MISIDVIIPIYKEQENLREVITKLNHQVKANLHFLICYDFDEESGLNFLPNIKNITKVKNNGRSPSEAILAGINNSNSEFILVYMADDFENIDLINTFITLSNKYDLIIPSRYIKGGRFKNAKLIKKFIAILGYVLLNKILRIPYKDCTNAFKFFRRNIINDVKFESKAGFTYAMELTIKCNFLKKRIIEIPCTWRDLENRVSNFKIVKWLPYYLYWAFRAFKYQVSNFFK